MSWDLFQGSVPGQSLTNELGSAPHELPPQFADINDALEFLMDKLTQPRQVTRLVLLVKKGVPVEYIAKSILFQGFGTGQWTPDAALLMLRIVMAQIIAICVAKGVNPKIFNPDKDQEAFLDQFLDMADDTGQPPIGSAEPKGGLTGLPATFTGLLGAEV